MVRGRIALDFRVLGHRTLHLDGLQVRPRGDSWAKRGSLARKKKSKEQKGT